MKDVSLIHLIPRSLLFSRLKYSAVIMAVLIAFFSLGPLIPLTAEEGRRIEEQIERIIQENIALGIFLNNFIIALVACIPFVGAPLMAYIAFNTGRFVGWSFLEFGLPKELAIPANLLMIIFSGFGLLEFMGYAVMVCESLVLTKKIIQRIIKRKFDKIRSELKELLAMIATAGFLLAVAAIIEAYFISILSAV